MIDRIPTPTDKRGPFAAGRGLAAAGGSGGGGGGGARASHHYSHYLEGEEIEDDITTIFSASGGGGAGAGLEGGGGFLVSEACPVLTHTSHSIDQTHQQPMSSIHPSTAPHLTVQIRRLEHFCRTVDGWLQERVALNQQLERGLAECVCSKFA